MLNDKQLDRMLQKLARYEETLDAYLFEKVASLEAMAYETSEALYQMPDASLFSPVEAGRRWGGEGKYFWLRADVTVPQALAGRDLFLRPHTEGYESMLWVDGKPYGTFNTKIVVTRHGNHYCDLVRQNAKAGETFEVGLEVYAGHYVIGMHPFEENVRTDFTYTYHGLDLCVKNELVQATRFDLQALNELVESLPEDSFRRAQITRVLYEVHKVVYYSPEDTTPELFMQGLAKARELMAPALEVKNADSAPHAALVGHSHMDTAWLWHIGETIKKCARTYSNQLSLMDQYPEYTFVQSSSYHSELIRRHYPELFERIKARVLEGRYEPNSGVWIECDANIVSGESLVRQFLWGQRFTRKHFGYTADCFWLPDTFGYSAAIPQVMKGCGVSYFLTTKMAWNDTNKFPYSTFYWEGIDGTRVLSHLNRMDGWAAPRDLINFVSKGDFKDTLNRRVVAEKRLISYGFGDGGGGPQFEMIEMARRCKDLDGVPKSEHVVVGKFMQELEKSLEHVDVYRGELYLEIHRGTLTNQHPIKRNNRKGEIAIHNLEYLCVQNAVAEGKAADGSAYAPLVETLLVNQFHDILPGTCISRAHDESIAAMGDMIAKANEGIEALAGKGTTVLNTLPFERRDVVYLDASVPGAQSYVDFDGNTRYAVGGLTIPALGGVKAERGKTAAGTPFVFDGDRLETPFASISFDEKGRMVSFVDKRAGRELRAEDGYALNTLLMAEDVSLMWDGWDIDADIQMKFADTSKLISREVISSGAVELRIRSVYQISEKSSVIQDMVFYADSPLVRFDTRIDWNDKHRFLKAAFDVSVRSDFARQEVQFGNVLRPTTSNTGYDQAKFEVSNHKYTDLSEPRFGVAILNDCKYGIGIDNGRLRLSLHKGGTRPDPRGDIGVHDCSYAFLPHEGGFSAETVIQPAYAFNYPVVAAGMDAPSSLVALDAPNVIVETIKPCEDAQKAYILRVYEAEGSHTSATLSFGHDVKAVELTDMLEEPTEALGKKTAVTLTFTPFQIRTLKVSY